MNINYARERWGGVPPSPSGSGRGAFIQMPANAIKPHEPATYAFLCSKNVCLDLGKYTCSTVVIISEKKLSKEFGLISICWCWSHKALSFKNFI